MVAVKYSQRTVGLLTLVYNSGMGLGHLSDIRVISLYNVHIATSVTSHLIGTQEKSCVIYRTVSLCIVGSMYERFTHRIISPIVVTYKAF